MLLAIKEAPVNSLTGRVTTDVAVAQRVLSEENIAVQTKGYAFNTEYNYPLSPDITGEIAVPQDIVSVDADNQRRVDAVLRGRRLYDRLAHTFTFTDTLKCKIIRLLPYEDLPQAARHYVTVRAVRKFQNKILGVETIDGYNADDQRDAKQTLEDAEADTADFNIFDNYSAASILDRTGSVS